MSGICITTLFGAVLATLPVDRFTLAWEHSVEKVRWEEDYERRGDTLVLTAARVHGHGAGMEVPDGATRHGDAWEYRPHLSALASLRLAASPEGGDYDVCISGGCRPLRTLTRNPGPLEFRACH